MIIGNTFTYFGAATLQITKYTLYLQEKMIARALAVHIQDALKQYPAVAILGPRQVGKTTLALSQLEPLGKKQLYLDMERPSDRIKLEDAENFLTKHQDQLVVIDEVQSKIDLFPVLRSLIDAHRVPGRFLLLGSASDLLISKSAESLAGRISYKELHPFSIAEIPLQSAMDLWIRGGYPPAFLASSDEMAFDWMDNFVRTHIERELGVTNLRTTPFQLSQFLRVLSSLHGQLMNYSQLAQAMQLSIPTVKNYLDFFEHAFLLRTLQPYHANVQKRLIKSPKLYIRDSGMLHYLRGIDSLSDLEGDVLKGASWEGFCLQQVMAMLKPSILPYFYRTAAGAEVDLLLLKGNAPFAAFEFKYSNSPQITKGNLEALNDLACPHAYVVTPSAVRAAVRPGMEIIALNDLPVVMNELGVRV